MDDNIILIGNGFDIAHGLQTKYTDFILWYANQTISEFNSIKKRYKATDFFILTKKGEQIPLVSNIIQLANNEEIKPNNEFFKNIINYASYNKWVDIEYAYYNELVTLYKSYEQTGLSRINLESRAKSLNNTLEHLKNKLGEYLNELNYEKLEIIPDILSRFKTEKLNKENNRTVYIIFNYTKTFDLLYKEHVVTKNDIVIYIHGELNSTANPIIFGYGDETDKYYQEIERLNINELTKNFKSFKYLNSFNYKNIFYHINNPYNVTIIGHSCGISDRVLLKEIFTSDLCKTINAYHYKKDDGTTDFEEKTQEISRHFPSHLKHKMRNIVYDSGPLIFS